MYRNAVLQTLNRRLFSAILKKLFEAARNAHIDPYTSKGVFRKLFKNPRAKPDGTKMFCSAFLNDARMCCFFANAIVKY